MRQDFDSGLRGLAVAALALAVAGCANSRGGSIPYDTSLAIPDPAQTVVSSENYRLAPGDKLNINVFQVEDLTGDYVVDFSGKIAFPLLGGINVLGMTSEELSQRLEADLGAKYIQNPRVAVGIVDSTGRKVTVDGAVRDPGVFPVTSEMTLISAIALAKGTDENANARRVAVFRRVSGQRLAAAFDLTSIRRGEMDDPKIYPGDVVVVEGSANRALLRDVFGALPVLALFRPY